MDNRLKSHIVVIVNRIISQCYSTKCSFKGVFFLIFLWIETHLKVVTLLKVETTLDAAGFFLRYL